ncbi:MAG: DUF4416 family protein [Phycisphaerales bacterium]|nr:DUF4416 family protein [Phycisphaerales bacterium]
MGKPRRPDPVKLICGVLANDADRLRRAQQLMTRRYGPIDAESPITPFDHTDYYAEEMGPGLLRGYWAFERLIHCEQIAEIKLETNAMEQRLGDEMLDEYPRPVNLDPGYLSLNKLTLATTKDANHRVYVGHGLYVEPTLRYEHENWRPWPWTYADYQLDATRAFFRDVRGAYRTQLREWRESLGGGGGE